MRFSSGYRILDEPLPGRLERFAVNPIWPLFAFMFGGALFGWAWSIVNAQALGSPTRKRESGLVLLGVAGIVAIAICAGLMVQYGTLSKAQAPWVLLVMMLWKLGITYWIFSLQSRTFELYQYFGGIVRNGLALVVAAYFARNLVQTASKGNAFITLFL